MNKYLLILLLFVCGAGRAFAQEQYEISQDEKHPEVKVLRGIINKDLIKNDTAFAWYKSSQSYYNPDTATINAFKRANGKYHFVVFGGTWCEDTQFILPKFFKLQELSGLTDDAISLFGVNRAKNSLGNITKAFDVTLVPTIIVMKDGKEMGRVVEYGKTGKWDKELTDILNQ